MYDNLRKNTNYVASLYVHIRIQTISMTGIRKYDWYCWNS